MSGSSDDDSKIYKDSPPTSPNPLSSPAKPDISTDNSSQADSSKTNSSSNDDFENQSDNSSSSFTGKLSPPSSPVRPGRKRPSYGGYKENPLIPVPRQTLHRWKKSRVDEQSDKSSHNDDSSEDRSLDDTAVVANKGEILASSSQVPNVTFHQPDFSEDSIDQTCTNLSENSFSDSSEDDESSINSERNDNASLGEYNLSNGSYSNNSDSSDVNGGSEIDSDITNDDNDPFEADWLYPGCEKTKDEAVYEIMNIYLSKKLSKSALKGTLKCYVSSLPKNNVMPPTVHLLFNFVRSLSFPLNEKEHYYCRPAMHSVDLKSVACPVCQSKDIGIFYELPLENILKYLLEQWGLANVIDKYTETRSQTVGSICDITDGSEYKRVWSGVITNQYKLTLILNTDGVSPHKSSKAKFWPLMFTIMEVPPHLRSSFTVVWGIWFDKKLKPDMNLFLKPFVCSLVKIYEDGGVSWKNSATHVTHQSPVSAPVLVADAPARAAVLNMQEHQAKYACNACEQKTSKLPAPLAAPGERQKSRKRRFIFKEEQAATLRTNQRIITCGNIAETNSEPKRGIKGLTVIRDVPSADLSTFVLAEYMHCVLGVVKQICSLWLFQPGEWYIGNHAFEMNRFLEEEIHPPNFISRLPRSLEYFCFLKANEFRSFLLYYSLVVAPYMKDKYHQHWMIFVQAIFLLLTEAISENNLLEAETLLRLFVRDLGSLYGDEQYVYNVHQLLHLGLYVRRWGCLWSNSAFSFEDMNGTLSYMIHGSKNEGRELLNQLTLAQGNQFLKNKIVTDTNRRVGLSVLGKPVTYILSDLEANLITELHFNVLEDMSCYGRVSVGREIFSSVAYDKNFKRRNSYVEVKYGSRKIYGRISVFCKCDDTVLCIVSVLKVVQSKFFFHRGSLTRIGHIIPIDDSGEIIVCKVKDIIQKLIQVGDYLCLRPNSIEMSPA